MEILEQTDHIDAVFVSVGGGGLISGIAGYIKTVSPNTKIIGCLPKNSPVMYDSIVQGKVIEMNTLETLSDGTAGGMEPNSITFELCRQYVDDYCLVSEQAIQKAMCSLIGKQHLLIEGAAGVALAGLFKRAKEYKGKKVVVVLSGANISLSTLDKVIKHSSN